MSTVPKSDTPPPPNNAKTLTLQSDPNLYVRPTAGGNRSGETSGPLGNAPAAAPAGDIPYNPIHGGIDGAPPDGSLTTAYNDPNYMMANAGTIPGTHGTQVGPNMGHGATIVTNNSGDRPSGAPDGAVSGGGTVGDSGPQGS